MNLSYWEIKSWLSEIDYAIVGSGIVGLSCAIRLRELHPKAKIIVFERGDLPQGASTKNAGFACFGSMTEILDDLNNHNEKEVVNLVQQRIQGLRQLRTLLGDNRIGFQQLRGYEIFLENEKSKYEKCAQNIPLVNALLASVTKGETFQFRRNTFGFRGVQDTLIFNPYEGQINTGDMMQSLLKKVYEKDIRILHSAQLHAFADDHGGVQLDFGSYQTRCSHLLIATNGFASELMEEDVVPNRAQVLITKPVPNLKVKGTFHMDRGYYYFRNIENRILLGGGRNLDFEGEQTSEMGLNPKIQKHLEELLRGILLPNQKIDIDYRWSGILGTGQKKTSLIKRISKRVSCGVRLGGMGIAIGCHVGFQLAQLSQD